MILYKYEVRFMGYKIGSFNCLNLGMGAAKDIQKFADIIINEQFDIIALQEIKGPLALLRIQKLLPPHWKGAADTEVNDYAFLWNSRRFDLANADEIGISRVYHPRIYKQYKIDRKSGQTDLIREPFFARFFPVGGAAPYIEVRIINTHIRFTKGSDPEPNTPGAVGMRKNEFDILTRAIYAKEADKRYGNNRPAYTILLGDYNLNLPSSGATAPYLLESFEIEDGRSSKIITTVQRDLTTLSKSENNPDNNKIFSNNYDHFTYDIKRFLNVTVSCNRVNTVEKYCENNQELHIKDISDHVPIKMDLTIRR